MADQERHPRVPAGRHHLPPIGHRVGDRFLHVDVFACLGGQEGVLGMDVVGCREENAVDITPLQDSLETLLLIAAVLRAEGRAFLRVSE